MAITEAAVIFLRGLHRLYDLLCHGLVRRGVNLRPGSLCRGPVYLCGKELEAEGIVLGGKIFMWKPIAPRCKCEQAQIYWAEHDRKEAERKVAEEEAERPLNVLQKVA